MKYNYSEGFNIKKLIGLTAILLLVVYGVFNARRLIEGPKIEILQPADGYESSSNTVSVKGMVKNATFVSINDRPISIDTSGMFEEDLLLSPGYNIVRIFANDRFKKDTGKEISIYYNNQASSTPLEVNGISSNN